MCATVEGKDVFRRYYNISEYALLYLNFKHKNNRLQRFYLFIFHRGQS